MENEECDSARDKYSYLPKQLILFRQHFQNVDYETKSQSSFKRFITFWLASSLQKFFVCKTSISSFTYNLNTNILLK